MTIATILILFLRIKMLHITQIQPLYFPGGGQVPLLRVPMAARIDTAHMQELQLTHNGQCIAAFQ